MQFPVNKLNACNYNEIASNVVLFNINELVGDVWIKLPNKFSRCFALRRVDRLLKVEEDSIEFADFISKENIWLKIQTNFLELSPGQHIYRIWLNNEKFEQEEYVLYFSYIVQDDNPEKPYMYMHKE